jgi:serine protease Do
MSGTRRLFLYPLILLLAGMAAGPPPRSAGLSGERAAFEPAQQVQASDSARLGPPKPAAVRRKDLPAALTKPAPASLTDLKAIEQHVRKLIVRVSPAVVAVEVGSGSGSGVVITPDGLVLTAGHVCERPNRDVRFTFPGGKIAHGKTVGLDRASDTGLMRITDAGPWPFVPTGELSESAPGDWVLALGHPGGFDVKRSLVIRLGRIIRLGAASVQTDCTISPGDSGGPLFDMHGRVVAIHSAISRSPTENFHVTINEFYQTWSVLAQGSPGGRRPDRPRTYVGARGVDDPEGCRISAIEQDSPADRAGLRVGDVVRRIEGRDIKVAASFRRWVDESRPGETLKLEIERGDQALSVLLELEAEPRPNK